MKRLSKVFLLLLLAIGWNICFLRLTLHLNTDNLLPERIRGEPQTFNSITAFTSNYTDYGFDSDGDGGFNFLTIDIEVNISRKRSSYYLEVELIPVEEELYFPLYEGRRRIHLDVGIKTISVQFEGFILYSQRLNTSYRIKYLDFGYLGNQGATYYSLDKIYDCYITHVYSYSEFDPPAQWIDINGNVELNNLVNVENWTGKGTSDDPYIIEDLTITSSYDQYVPLEIRNTFSPITILISFMNTNAHFHIRNCTLKQGTIGIYFSNVTNGFISNNILKNNENAIKLESVNDSIITYNLIHKNDKGIIIEPLNSSNSPSGSSNNNSIINNVICNNENICIILGNKSQNNSVKWNDFKENPAIIDYGQNNTFLGNYWSDCANNDSNEVQIILNHDPMIQLSPNHLSQPLLRYPNGGEFLINPTVIDWDPAVDALGLNITYSVYFSSDKGSSWILIDEKLANTSFYWDISNISYGSSFLIKIIAYDSIGFFSMDISDRPFTIWSSFQPLFRLFFQFSLLVLVFFLLFILIKKQRYRKTHI